MPHTEERTFCWRLTNESSFSADIYGCIFHSFSVWYNFCNTFSSKTACWPPDKMPWTTFWETLPRYMSVESHDGMILMEERENWRDQRKTCPSATSPITNHTWTDLSTNPGCCGERLTLLTTWAIVGHSVKVKNAWNYTSTHRTSSWSGA
jgi:hypothetical protein